MQKTILSLLLVIFALGNATAQHEQSFITLGDTIRISGYEQEAAVPKSKRMKQFVLDVTAGYTFRAPRYGFVNGIKNDILFLKGIQNGFNAGGSFSFRFHRNMAAGILYSFNRFNNTELNTAVPYMSGTGTSTTDHVSIYFLGPVFKVLFPLRDDRFCLGYSLGAGVVHMNRNRHTQLSYQASQPVYYLKNPLIYHATDYACYFDINAAYRLHKHISLLLQASCVLGTFNNIHGAHDYFNFGDSSGNSQEYTEGCSLVQVSMGVRCNF